MNDKPKLEQNWMVRFICHLRDVICGEKIPVWLTLLLMLIGAGATYFIAPRINHAFEMQAVKREFVLKNLDGLNTNTQFLLKMIPSFLDQVEDSKRAEILEIITAMQFDSVRLNYTIPNRIDSILNYQKSLEKLNILIDKYKSNGGNREEVMNSLKSVSYLALQLYRGILSDTGISVSREK